MNPDLKNIQLDEAISAAVSAVGINAVRQTLLDLADRGGVQESHIITIITNAGVHHLPEDYRRGELFIASAGNLDFSTPESLHSEFTRVLNRVARKLKSKEWRRVYIVPFGPSALSMQIKLLVYKICDLESIEVMHVSQGPRVDVSIDIRQLIIDCDTPESA